jgi:arylsulfatase A-like enzyme
MRVVAALTIAVGFLASPGVFAEAAPADAGNAAPGKRPNVLIIMTDDQGYGDLACNGNPVVRTPNLDKFAKEGVRLTNFYVSPVCSPTRASLLTGRYNYRTGVVDTFLGRSLMHTDEVTLAEMLRWAGYRTGIFGKWHLGDNYPMRPMDQGFGESLVLKGGGLGQPSDIVGADGEPGGSYVDPVLLRNGHAVKTSGYVSDVLAGAAADFIRENKERPFFAYLAFNAPHEPLGEVPQAYLSRYKSIELTASRFVSPGWPLPEKLDTDKIERVYSMVSNIDDNVGRVLATLKELRLERDTIVVFLTDNGPQHPRFNAGMRGLKGTPYDGGIHVPCYVRWPAGLGVASGSYVDRVAAHIDVVPTLLEACGVPPPPGVALDGVSLLPLLKGDVPNDNWRDRTLFFQWHRGDTPQAERSFGARSQRWKFVQPAGAGGQDFLPRFELYDLSAEPAETRNVADRNNSVVEEMRDGYRNWFEDVTSAHAHDAPRIVVGTPHENPVVLTRQDWRGPRAGWGPKDLGHWDVDVAEAGDYGVALQLVTAEDKAVAPIAGADARPAADTVAAPRTLHFRVGALELERPIAPGLKSTKLPKVHLPAGPAKLEAWISQGDETVGVRSLEVLNLGEPIS